MKQNKATSQPESAESKKNKIVVWVNDGFPPIDLNQQVTHVKELVNAYQQQAKDIELLKNALNGLIGQVTDDYKTVWSKLEDGLPDEDIDALQNEIDSAIKALKQTEPKQ